MIGSIDFSRLRFEQAAFLWLLVLPAALLLLWVWRFMSRRRDARQLAARRLTPVRERFPIAGSLPFWLCLIAASVFLIVALARPVGRLSAVRTAGVDIVVLQDGSASMRVTDVAGNRWRRSMKFLRVLGDQLSWQDDRMALALFAHIAAPQIRLTRDPNTFYFFLDHLTQESPFRQEDDTTWDTNIEAGIYWGVRLIEKDEELHGRKPNAKVFLVLSDGQAWSGRVSQALDMARARNIPVYVVGVGTQRGGVIPDPKIIPGAVQEYDPEISTLDRESLEQIAASGQGQYFELDREGDREIANAVIDAARRRSGTRGLEETTEELYWRFLLASAWLVVIGVVFLRERAELWMQLAGAAASLLIVSRLLR